MPLEIVPLACSAPTGYFFGPLKVDVLLESR